MAVNPSITINLHLDGNAITRSSTFQLGNAGEWRDFTPTNYGLRVDYTWRRHSSGDGEYEIFQRQYDFTARALEGRAFIGWSGRALWDNGDRAIVDFSYRHPGMQGVNIGLGWWRLKENKWDDATQQDFVALDSIVFDIYFISVTHLILRDPATGKILRDPANGVILRDD